MRDRLCSWKALLAACLVCGAFPALCALTGRNPSGADSLLIEAWDSDRGLPQNSVVSIAQTPEGYLWVGSWLGGLARFDGVSFARFDPASTPELSQVEISRLLTSSDGTLWISQVGGTLATWKDGRFTRETPGAENPSVALRQLLLSTRDQVLFTTEVGWLLHGRRGADGKTAWKSYRLHPEAEVQACASKDGRVWYAGADRQLYCWQDGKTTRAPDPGLQGHPVECLATDLEGWAWFGTSNGLARWKDGQFDQVALPKAPSAFPPEQLAFVGDGGLWIRSGQTVRKLFEGKWSVSASIEGLQVNRSSEILSLHGDRDGSLWVMHRHDGLWKVSTNGNVQRLSVAEGLPAGLLESWFQDREGNVWLGLNGGGLVRIRKRTFHTVQADVKDLGQVVRSVCEDRDGGIWLGYSEGKLVRWHQGAFSEVKLPPGGIPVRDVTVWPATNDALWVGSVASGAWQLRDGTPGRPFAPAAIGTVVRAGYTDQRGQTWFGSEYGLFRYANGKIARVGRAEGLRNSYILALAEDPSGALWIGTAQGSLCRFHQGKLARYELLPGDPYCRLWTLLIGSDGSVWAGTLGGGLFRWKDGKLSRATEEDGLPTDTITQLLEDDAGRLWAGTQSGIFSVPLKELNEVMDGHRSSIGCRTFNKSDGLPTLECSAGFQPGCWKARDGRLWFATVKGAVSVNPQDVPINTFAPNVVIEEMRVDGKTWADTLTNRPAEYRIPAGRHYVEFKFTAPSLVAPEKVRFQSRLRGQQTEWLPSTSQRSASYNFLPPGRYTFEVRAYNEDHVWSKEAGAITFTILPYFWQRWWFPVVTPAVAAFLLGLTGFVILRRRHHLQVERLRHAQALEQERTRAAEALLLHQKELERERTRIARDLHDDLGASLTHISWLSEAAAGGAATKPEDRDLLQQIAEKSRGMVRTINEIVWAVNPRNDSLDHLATYLCQFAEYFFRKHPTRCRLDVQEPLPSRVVTSDVRHNVFLIVKEALNNVAKHADASEVWLRVGFEDTTATIVVQDDGRGFSPHSPYTTGKGNGLGNMKSRAEALGATIQTHSLPGAGTTVTLKLPVAPQGKSPPGGDRRQDSAEVGLTTNELDGVSVPGDR